MSAIYVFGYGSLVNSEDLMYTIGRQTDMQPVQLIGWLRDWSVIVENATKPRRFVETATGHVPKQVVTLNVRRPGKGETATHPNGVIFEVTADELAALDEREFSYKRVDVTENIFPAVDGIVYTYTGLPEHLQSPSNDPDELILPASYRDVVTTGFANLSPIDLLQFELSTMISRVPIHKAVFR